MDASLKETNVWRSIKKFFVDGLGGTDITPYFDRIVSTTDKDITKWVNILVENIDPHHVSDANMTIFCISKEDREGDELSEIRDTIIDLLYPGHIDFYDTSVDPWSKVGGMVVINNGQSNTVYNPDQSKMLYIQTTIKWGAVWS